MGLLTYIGHRMLSFGLIFIGIIFLLGALISGSFIAVIIAIAIILAGSYFAKTQHH